MINQSTIIQRKSEIFFSKIDDEYLALDAQAGFCYSLDLVSGHIWCLIEQPTVVASLCTELQQEYAVSAVACQRDVIEVLTQLATAGLVTVLATERGHDA